jgi:hypothetical protein
VAAGISEDQIRKMATAWYQALDMHVPTDQICRLLADPDVEMVFPEKTLHGLNNFVAWYSGGTYSDGQETKGVINIFFDENHNVVSVEPAINGETADVKVVVAWQASWFEGPATKSKRTSLDATQTWKVRRSNKNEFGLEITSYNAVAQPFQYAPGFARL